MPRRKRKFWSRVFRFQGLPRVAGLQGVYSDALILARRIYRAERWGREYMSDRMFGRMPESRWTKANKLLRLSGVVNEKGAEDRGRAPTIDDAEELLREKANQIQEQCERNPRFVSPI